MIAGAPEGFDAQVVSRLAKKHGAERPRPILHVAEDEARMERMAECLRFYAPGLETLTFPAWDCLPYDRVSPNGEVVARRIETLAKLAGGIGEGEPLVVVTTVSAVLQRAPPRDLFREAIFAAGLGDRLSLDDLAGYLARNGYNRADTVREPGEYALRGGIVDLFPPGSEEPLRLDLFGDAIEAIRSFDPVTQRSDKRLERFSLKPVSEVLLTEESIGRFRSGYRDLFGAARRDDLLYEAVSAGRRYSGMEHWLPLFYERIETLFDYLPDAAVTLDPNAEDAVKARLDTIADYYAARVAPSPSDGEAPYRPLPPDRLYLGEAEWADLVAPRPVGVFSPFAAPEHAAGFVDAGGRPGRDFADVRARPDANVFDALRDLLTAEAKNGRHSIVACYSDGSRERFLGLLRDHGINGATLCASWHQVGHLAKESVALVILPIEHGFAAPDAFVVTEQDILGDRLARPPRRRRHAEAFIAEASNLGEGDFVVHVEHGIGRYEGLETLDVGGAPHDCLKLIYRDGDKLYVPVESIEVLSRYGSEGSAAELDKLGGAGWQARKARVRKRIKDIADQLLRIAAARELHDAPVLTPPEGLYDEFAARFPYAETDDQLTAIADSIADLASGRPMDRLICGDVGFGKTEVALRVAFTAVMSGVQVAVVTPTTLLARQHLITVRRRFEGLPVRIGSLSRLSSATEAASVKQGLANGSVDIVVGTHALLAKDLAFRNLGLLIVDEEQHFGVVQKERLKQLRANIHVLTLTATPIPRTLQMALAGVKEMSLIATPPVDRLAVRTFVLPFDPVVVREAILREHYRGGQTFYVCPRIEDLAGVAERIKKLVPEIRIATAHGKLAARQLETVMSEFYDGKFDLLISTNIIESGLDIPSANTLIVHRADMFGLAQLYQLRGRIGRSKQRAYAYLTLPPGRVLNPTAQRRLEILHALDSLGAGFSLASHDLDIRGAGNLLGDEQSGHIREVGIELYQSMLEQAVAEVRGGGQAAEEWTPQISISMPVLIPESYVADLGVRLGLYRRIANLQEESEIEAFAAEMIDRFGPLPAEAENLFSVVALKRLCRDANVEKIEAGPRGAVLTFRDNHFANPAGLIDFIARHAGTVKLRPDHKLVVQRTWDTGTDRAAGLRQILRDIAAIAARANSVEKKGAKVS